MSDKISGSIARQLYQLYYDALGEAYERCGYVENGQAVELPNFVVSPGLTLWRIPDEATWHITWHTHPDAKDYAYMPPSGFDLEAGMRLSYDLNRATVGYVIERSGVWAYRCDARRRVMGAAMLAQLSHAMELAECLSSMLSGVAARRQHYPAAVQWRPANPAALLESFALAVPRDYCTIAFFPAARLRLAPRDARGFYLPEPPRERALAAGVAAEPGAARRRHRSVRARRHLGSSPRSYSAHR